MWIVPLIIWIMLGIGTAAAFECAGVTLSSSLVICSDPELMRLADERQEAINEARARIGEDRWPQLWEDQKAWVRSYATVCGVSPDRPLPVPVPAATRACFKRAAEARIAYIQAYGLPGGATPLASPTAASTTPPAAAVPTPLVPPAAHPGGLAPTAPAVNAAQYWWCPSARAYYPQAQICPTGTWQQVAPTQPPPPRPFYGQWHQPSQRYYDPQERKVYQRPDGTFGVGTMAEVDAENAEHERLKRQQEANATAEGEAREAQARIARAEAERKYKAAVFEQQRIAREGGTSPSHSKTSRSMGRNSPLPTIKSPSRACT
jgi:hypothetical protein